jgi:uncharacterized protein
LASSNLLDAVMQILEREFYLRKIAAQFDVHRIVSLLGPRQCGKTTIAKQYRDLATDFNKANYFDLENPIDLERLDNPKTAFEALSGLIIIDEVQRRPELFQILRYIHDEYPEKRFLILGSASRDLIQQSSESLAGRIGYIEVTPFNLGEVPELNKLWLRGGFPPSFLNNTDEGSFNWRANYTRTYIEQDLPALGLRPSSENIRRFWKMISHFHGQIFNASQISSSLNLSNPTIKNYLELLADTFMIRILKPWHNNLSKRLVKSPKLFFRDSGLLHYFWNLETWDDLQTYPGLGASWEGFAMEQIIQLMGAETDNCYFWATHNQAELDLIILKKGKRFGFEFKYQDAPKITPSIRSALKELDLEKVSIIYPGKIDYPLSDEVNAFGLQEFTMEKLEKYLF